MGDKRFSWTASFGALLLFTAVGNAWPVAQQDQAPPPPAVQRGEERGMAGERTGGTITSVGVDRFELERMNGEAQTVLVADQTRIAEGPRENQKQLGLEDLKTGDHVMVMGKLNDQKEFVASVVHRMTPGEIARFQNTGNRAFGQITSIEGNQIKVHNPFRGDQLIVVSDQTTFTKDGQAITLKDLKVGDRVAATGKETDGHLAAERVFTGRFQRDRGRTNRPPADGLPPPPPENP